MPTATTTSFNTSRAIEQVTVNQSLPKPGPTIQEDETLMNSVFSVFTKTLSDLCLYFSFEEWGNQLLLMAKWAELRPDSYYKDLFGDRFLVRTVNLPPLDQTDHLEDGLKGGCVGSSELMLSLFFRTRDLFTNSREQLIAIARLFRKGLPKEAQALQTLKNDDAAESPHLGFSKRLFIQISSKDSFNDQLEKVVCAMVVAPLGTYTFHLPGHRMTWFKTSKNISYIHDLNAGLIELRSIKDLIQIGNIMLSTYPNIFSSHALTIRQVTPIAKKNLKEKEL